MNSPQGLENFDVLTSQVGDGYTYQVPIHKIGESAFTKVPQPTELSPIIPEEKHDEIVENNFESQEDFSVPRQMLDYLDTLIIKNKLPLRTLRFDIEFSKSRQEVANHLQTQAEKVGNIETEDLDKLFSFIGYGRQNTESEDDSQSDSKNPDITSEEVTQEVSGEEEVSMKVEEEEQPVDLSGLRDSYSTLHMDYRAKVLNDRRIYKRMMTELGADKDMPIRPEPKELVEARREYLELRKGASLGLNEGIDESQRLSDASLGSLSESTRDKIKKAKSFFDYYPNSTQFSESILSADLGGVERIVDPVAYEGMRVENIEQNIPAETSGVVDTPTDNVSIEEKIIEKVDEPQSEAQNNVDLVQNDVFSETVPISTTVDSSIAETIPLAQNVFPTEFEGKKLEVMHSFPNNPNEIKVFYDGKEIATGEATKNGGVVKIGKQYKSGFLLADTVEEKALKHSASIIKTLKSV